MVCLQISYAMDSLSGESIIAEKYTSKEGSALICPYCNKGVIFKGSHIINKNGENRKKHFAHKSGVACVNKVGGYGEGVEHKNSKDTLFSLLDDIFHKFSISPIIFQKEYRLISDDGSIERIADIYCEYVISGNIYKQAYEIQYSNISEKELQERHNDYIALGIDDRWFIGVNYKDISKTEKISMGREFGSHKYILLQGDERLQKLFQSSNIDKSRKREKELHLQRKPKQKILKKFISLFSKVSSFQDKVYFIDVKGIYLPKVIQLEFIIGLKNKYYGGDLLYFLNIQDTETKYGNISYENTMTLRYVQSLCTQLSYDSSLLRIGKSHLNNNFLLTLSNDLEFLDSSENEFRDTQLSLARISIKETQNKIDERAVYENTKFTDPVNFEIHIYREFIKLLGHLNVQIDIIKKNAADTRGDSLSWMNTKILKRKHGESNTNGFFGALNTFISKTYTDTPRSMDRSVESIKTLLNNFLIERRKYQGIDDINFQYLNFMNELNTINPVVQYEGVNYGGFYGRGAYMDLRYILREYSSSTINQTHNGALGLLYLSFIGISLETLNLRMEREVSELNLFQRKAIKEVQNNFRKQGITPREERLKRIQMTFQ